jgi:hypothetical protein
VPNQPTGSNNQQQFYEIDDLLKNVGAGTAPSPNLPLKKDVPVVWDKTGGAVTQSQVKEQAKAIDTAISEFGNITEDAPSKQESADLRKRQAALAAQKIKNLKNVQKHGGIPSEETDTIRSPKISSPNTQVIGTEFYPAQPQRSTYSKQASMVLDDNDKYAQAGGLTTPALSLNIQRNDIDDEILKANRDLQNYETNLENHRTVVDQYNSVRGKYNRLQSKVDNDKTLTESEKDEYDRYSEWLDTNKSYYAISSRAIQNDPNERQRYENAREKARQKGIALDTQMGRYQQAARLGQKALSKKEGLKAEYLRPFAEGAAEMLGTPKIGNISDVVGYGTTAAGVEKGLNTMFKGAVAVSPGANEWTRTRVGDRQLVESLVHVRPSGMITPFGTSGTIGGSGIEKQFNYRTPIRRIGVEDVTARPGYRLTPEDIRRKKKQAKIRANRGKPQGKVPRRIKGAPKKQKMTATANLVKSVSEVGKVNARGSIAGIVPFSKKTIEFGLNANIKPGGKKGIAPFTIKNIETNLNKTSKGMKKRKIRVTV